MPFDALAAWSEQDVVCLAQHVLEHGPTSWQALQLRNGCPEALLGLRWHALCVAQPRAKSVLPGNLSRHYSDWELCVLMVGMQAASGVLTKRDAYDVLSSWLPGRSPAGVKQAVQTYLTSPQANDPPVSAKLRANNWPSSLVGLLRKWPGPKPEYKMLSHEAERAIAADIVATMATPAAPALRAAAGPSAAAVAADGPAAAAEDAARVRPAKLQRRHSAPLHGWSSHAAASAQPHALMLPLDQPSQLPPLYPLHHAQRDAGPGQQLAGAASVQQLLPTPEQQQQQQPEHQQPLMMQAQQPASSQHGLQPSASAPLQLEVPSVSTQTQFAVPSVPAALSSSTRCAAASAGLLDEQLPGLEVLLQADAPAAHSRLCGPPPRPAGAQPPLPGQRRQACSGAPRRDGRPGVPRSPTEQSPLLLPPQQQLLLAPWPQQAAPAAAAAAAAAAPSAAAAPAPALLPAGMLLSSLLSQAEQLEQQQRSLQSQVDQLSSRWQQVAQPQARDAPGAAAPEVMHWLAGALDRQQEGDGC